jgi:hypothetical protein
MTRKKMTAWNGSFSKCCCCKPGESEIIAESPSDSGIWNLSQYKNRKLPPKYNNKWWYIYQSELNNQVFLASGQIKNVLPEGMPDSVSLNNGTGKAVYGIRCHQMCGDGGYYGRVIATNAGQFYTPDLDNQPTWDLKPYKNGGFPNEIARYLIRTTTGFGNGFAGGEVKDGTLINLPDFIQSGMAFLMEDGTTNGYNNYCELAIVCGNDCVKTINYSPPITANGTIEELFYNIYAPGMYGILRYEGRYSNIISIYTDCVGAPLWNAGFSILPSYVDTTLQACISLRSALWCEAEIALDCALSTS